MELQPLFQFGFLAHLSQRLRGELIGWESSRRPSVRPCVRACVNTFKHKYLRDQWADRNQILSEASFGWGKGCIRFWCRSAQNSGFHGNRQPPQGYNGENGVITFSRLFLIRSLSYLQVMMTYTRAWMSSKFGRIRAQTTELAALECLKKIPQGYNGENGVITFSQLFLLRSLLAHLSTKCSR